MVKSKILKIMTAIGIIATTTFADVALTSDNFPDANFLNYIKTTFDQGGSGVITADSILNIKVIHLGSQDNFSGAGSGLETRLAELFPGTGILPAKASVGVNSLEGIGFFTELEFLALDNTSAIVGLPNKFEKSADIDLSNNTKLLFLTAVKCGIESISLTNNTVLRILYLDDNNVSAISLRYNRELTNVRLSDNKNLSEIAVDGLTRLFGFSVNNTSIEELNVGANQRLGYFYISNNNKLKTIHGMEKLSNLQYFTCNNSKVANSLDFSGSPLLTSIECVNSGVERLDFSSNPELRSVDCSGNDIKTLDFTNNPQLNTLRCKNNKLTEIKGLQNKNLYHLIVYNNKLHNISVSSGAPLGNYYVTPQGVEQGFKGDNQSVEFKLWGTIDDYSTLVEFDNPVFFEFANISYDNVFRKLKSNNGSINSTKFVSQIGKDTYSLEGTMDLVYLTGEGIEIENDDNFPDRNFQLWLLNENNISGYGADGWLYPDEISRITAINVNNQNIADLGGIQFFTALRQLYCINNDLAELDVSNNVLLETLYCDNNSISELDVSMLTELKGLKCSNNLLEKLSLSENKKLTALFCNNNQLTALNVSKNTLLDTLNCNSNKIGKLELNSNTNLRRLECKDNLLTELDVSKNISLGSLVCSGNEIESLDLEKNQFLTGLDCSGNLLTKLDVTKNYSVKNLYCQGNLLEILDISGLSLIEELDCSNNKLTFIDLTSSDEHIYHALWGNGQTPTIKLTGFNDNFVSSDIVLNDVENLVEGIEYNGNKIVSNSMSITTSDFAVSSGYPYATKKLSGTMTFDYVCTHNFEYKITTAATCTTPGVETLSCTGIGCSATNGTRPVTQIAHTYEWKVTTVATCAAAGVETETCKVCTATNSTRPIAQLAHTNEWKTITAATCTAAGEEQEECKICTTKGAKRPITQLAHTNEKVVNITATCTRVGEEQEVCKVCTTKGTKYVIAQLAHTYEWDIISPNCLTIGERTQKCSECNVIGNKENIPAAGHDYEWTLTTPNCLDKGEETQICKVCEAIGSKRETAATGHDYEWIVTTPNCLTIGEETQICKVCETIGSKREAAATGHKYEWKITTPNCLNVGVKTETCTVCEATGNSEDIPAEGHNYFWSITKMPTCLAIGEQSQTCKVCEAAGSKKDIPAYGHNFSALGTVVISGDCNTDPEIAAIHKAKCSRCVVESNDEALYLTGPCDGKTSIIVNDNDGKYGIKFAKNIVNDKAEISIILPKEERVVEAKIVIYDAIGNIVFNATTNGKVDWNLTNNAGRIAANGTYLVIAEVKGVNNIYAYSAKLGVKR